jgi:hypothetical protein
MTCCGNLAPGFGISFVRFEEPGQQCLPGPPAWVLARPADWSSRAAARHRFCPRMRPGRQRRHRPPQGHRDRGLLQFAGRVPELFPIRWDAHPGGDARPEQQGADPGLVWTPVASITSGSNAFSVEVTAADRSARHHLRWALAGPSFTREAVPFALRRGRADPSPAAYTRRDTPGMPQARRDYLRSIRTGHQARAANGASNVFNSPLR